ncbi:MAG: DoxX family protein [Planctomycetia bacterium]|nr:DoxX family protein [Planctomycetia bacterium]
MLSVIALVVLRVTIGWHFLYEGVWKLDNADKFSALPFLTQAKGPFAEMFYAMSPDLNGKERLKTENRQVIWWVPKGFKTEVQKNENPPYVKTEWKLEKMPRVPQDVSENALPEMITVYPAYFDPTDEIYSFILTKFIPSEYASQLAAEDVPLPDTSTVKCLSKEQLKQLRTAWGRYVISIMELQKEGGAEMEAYLASLKRLEEAKKGGNNGPTQQKRLWDDMMKLRVEANTFLNELNMYSSTFINEVNDILTPEQRAAENLPDFVVTTDRLPYGVNLPFIGRSWTKFLDFSVSWALTLIGACLILGLCSRLAALGGGCFMLMILMTQPPWPSIYPPFHPEVGHAMIVDKNFIEMVSIFMLATLPVGRWGGLDFFLWNCFGKPLAKAFRLIHDDE